MLIVMDRLEQVEIFDFHMPHHGTRYNTNYMTAVMYQVTGLTCSFVYSMGLQPAGINQLVRHITLYFFHMRPAAHNNGCGPLT